MITPIGILAVNASAFVMTHLVAFRIGIAACAVVSGLVLNGLTAWWLLRLVSRQAPPLYREYRLWALGASVLIVLLTAAAGGYLTYLGGWPGSGASSLSRSRLAKKEPPAGEGLHPWTDEPRGVEPLRAPSAPPPHEWGGVFFTSCRATCRPASRSSSSPQAPR